MSLIFASGGLSNSLPPVVGYPFSLGMWINLQGAGAVVRSLFSIEVNGGAGDNYFAVEMDATEKVRISAKAGGALDSATVSTALTAGKWCYIVARFIDAANRRISILHFNGLPEHAQSTVSVSPSGLNLSFIGNSLNTIEPNSAWFGMIAEFWFANADIQPDGALLQEPMLRTLAYGGPFLLRHIVRNIVDYRAFRFARIRSGGDERIGEMYNGGPFGRQYWVNDLTVTGGVHPPLPYWYRRPDTPVTSWRRLLQTQEMVLPTPPIPTQFVVQSNLKW